MKLLENLYILGLYISRQIQNKLGDEHRSQCTYLG